MDDAAVCPLCGQANDCGAVEGRSECWCFTATVPEAVLARLPESERDRRCVCQRCASSIPSAPAALAE